jgi:hypothetical protein
MPHLCYETGLERVASRRGPRSRGRLNILGGHVTNDAIARDLEREPVPAGEVLDLAA